MTCKDCTSQWNCFKVMLARDRSKHLEPVCFLTRASRLRCGELCLCGGFGLCSFDLGRVLHYIKLNSRVQIALTYGDGSLGGRSSTVICKRQCESRSQSNCCRGSAGEESHASLYIAYVLLHNMLRGGDVGNLVCATGPAAI